MSTTAGALVVDGFHLRTLDPGERGWAYVPAFPTFESAADGTPMLSIVEAGSFAFMQATARLALSDAGRERLLRRLRAVCPHAERLDVAPIRVSRVTFEVRTDAGWHVVAESRSSGSAPWLAAFSATLTPEALTALRAAVSGEPGRARLRAWIATAFPAPAFRSAEASHSIHAETSSGVTTVQMSTSCTESAPANPPETLELESDIARMWRARS
jgi:hypothetical protein